MKWIEMIAVNLEIFRKKAAVERIDLFLLRAVVMIDEAKGGALLPKNRNLRYRKNRRGIEEVEDNVIRRPALGLTRVQDLNLGTRYQAARPLAQTRRRKDSNCTLLASPMIAFQILLSHFRIRVSSTSCRAPMASCSLVMAASFSFEIEVAAFQNRFTCSILYTASATGSDLCGKVSK